MEFKGLVSEIKSNDIITIFRHEHPDCDAYGSQFGLKSLILDNWPEKKVYVLGNEHCTQGNWPDLDTASDLVISESLVIVCDTANIQRIDDKRFSLGRKLIKIDHHPNREPFGEQQYVVPKASATCQIIADLIEQEDLKFSTQTAEFLFRGLLTDTLCFRTSNTTSDTLKAASFLSKKNIDIPAINRELFDISLKDFTIANFIRNNLKISSAIGYVIVDQNVLQAFDITASGMRNFIDEIGHIKELQIWAIFTQCTEYPDKRYDASLRSKTVIINEIAEAYGGGGHPQACGIKNLTEYQVNSLIEQLKRKVTD